MTIPSVIPDLIDALVAQCPAVMPDGVDVYDGQAVTDDPDNCLMIGVDDPDLNSAAVSGATSQGTATMGTNRPRDQEGDIYLTAIGWNGDSDQKAARDRAYAIAAGVAGLCRTNPSLGVAAAGLVVTGFGAVEQLIQEQDDGGATAWLTFTIHFRARI